MPRLNALRGCSAAPAEAAGLVVLPVVLLATAAAHHPVTAAALLPAIGAAHRPGGFPGGPPGGPPADFRGPGGGPGGPPPGDFNRPGGHDWRPPLSPQDNDWRGRFHGAPWGDGLPPWGWGAPPPPIWDGPLPADVGAAATADQLLRLQRATGVGRRLQPVGFLFLRDLDSATGLTDNPARRPPRIIPGRSSTRQRSE